MTHLQVTTSPPSSPLPSSQSLTGLPTMGVSPVIVSRQLTELALFSGHLTAQFLIMKIDSGKALGMKQDGTIQQVQKLERASYLLSNSEFLREQLETQTDFSVNANSSFPKLFLFPWRFHHSESKPKLEPKEGKPTLTTKPKHRAHITAYAIPFDYRGRILTHFDANISLVPRYTIVDNNVRTYIPVVYQARPSVTHLQNESERWPDLID